MDMDTSGGASTSAATSAATSTTADASHVNLLVSEQKYVGYRDMITDILQSLHDEIKDDWLPQIQAKCLDYGFSVEVNTKLFGGKTIMDLFNLLLDQHKHDFLKIILLMRDIIPTVVCDSLANEKLDLLAERIETDLKNLGLKPDQSFYGREAEIETLSKFTDFTQDQKARLINVCGMTGIGKSYLVKHLALQTLKEGRCAVIYVDASGVRSIADLLVAILEKVARFASGKAEDLMGTFCRFLDENKDSKILLILDDLSTIMSNKDNSDDLKSTQLVLEFLFDLTKRARNIDKKSKHCMLKTVVTTQKYMKMSSEKTEDKALVSVKQRLEDFTRDVSLDRLSDEDALKFLGPSLKTLTASDKEFLIKNCHGHPYSLHFVSSIASTDMNMTTEMTKMSGADVEAVNIELAEALFPKAYEKLTDLQKQVLLAIGLFDRDASLEALYNIIKPTDLTKSQFYDEVKMRFKNEFWLTFRVSDVKVEATRKTLVNTHHPLIRKFIKNKITNYYMSQPGTEQYAYFSQFKARFITYHVTELINIGKACVPQNVSNADFAKDICSRLMNNRSNFRIMLSLLLESENPFLLFSLDGACLRPDTDIVHLFLCMFEYFDCFDGNLRTVLGELIMRPVKESSVRVLLWALYTMALTTDQDWRTLDAIFQRPDKESDPKKIISVSQELYSFCKAIYGYCSGMLHTHASWYKERTDKQLISKRKEALDTGIKNLKLKHLSPTTDLARGYFSIHILLAQAEAIWTANRSNVNVIRQSYEVCRKAKKHSQQVLILEPLVYTMMGCYRADEGDQYDDVQKATDMYIEAQVYHKKAQDYFKRLKLDVSTRSAYNLDRYAVVMRSWANLLTNQNPVPDDDQKNAIKHLKRAADLSREAASIYDLLGSASRLSLLKSYFDAADSLERLQFETPQTDRTSRVQYQMEALKYYQKAYNLLKNDYRSCHLGPNDPTLERLIERLPQLLRMHHTPTETIDKVKYNLQKIREEVGKETSEGVNLSGSELYSSSDQESSEDDLVSSTEQLYMTGQQAVQPNFMSATNLVQETLPIQATDENLQSTKPMGVGPSPTAQGTSDSYTEEAASSKKRKL